MLILRGKLTNSPESGWITNFRKIELNTNQKANGNILVLNKTHEPGVEVESPSLVDSVSNPDPNSVVESALHSVNYNLKITITILKKLTKI